MGWEKPWEKLLKTEKVSNESQGDTPMEYSNLSESFFNFL